MTPEEKQLLSSISKTVEENNEMLHTIRRSQKWTSVLNWVYWIIIIGSAVGAFYLLQPYLTSITNTYSSAQNDLSSFKNELNSLKQK